MYKFSNKDIRVTFMGVVLVFVVGLEKVFKTTSTASNCFVFLRQYECLKESD